MQKSLLFLFTFCSIIFTVHAQNVIYLNINDNFQDVVNANPAGSVYVVKNGEHREKTVHLKDGDYIIGEPGALMNGARVLANWQFNGITWEYDVSSLGIDLMETIQGDCICECFYPIPDPLPVDAECGCERYQGCKYRRDLYLNGQPLWRVINFERFDNQQDQLIGDDTPYFPENFVGEWYYNSDEDKIHIYENPTGQLLELSMQTTAVMGAGITVKNLVVEKYYCNPQWGPIVDFNPNTITRFTHIENNEARYNHWKGILAGPNYIIRNNYVHHNGQSGISGSRATPETEASLVENNEIAHNNYAGFTPGWEGGAGKFVLNNGLKFRHNYVHRNNGFGLWTDIDNSNILYEGNVSEYNRSYNIFHEISFDATIRCNLLRNETGANLTIAESTPADIYYNTFIGRESLFIRQLHRGESDTYPGTFHCLKDLRFHHNQHLITVLPSNVGFVSGMYPAPDGLTVCDPAINTYYDYNHYHQPPPVITGEGGIRWAFYVEGTGSTGYNWEQFQAIGQELHGTIDGNTNEADLQTFPFCENLTRPLLLKAQLESGCGYDFQNPPTNFPILQPFNQNPWNHDGRELAPGLLPNAIDWVLLEARSPDFEATLIERKAGILLNDGRIINAIPTQRGVAGIGDELDGVVFYDLVPNQPYLFSAWTSSGVFDMQLFVEEIPNEKHLVFCAGAFDTPLANIQTELQAFCRTEGIAFEWKINDLPNGTTINLQASLDGQVFESIYSTNNPNQKQHFQPFDFFKPTSTQAKFYRLELVFLNHKTQYSEWIIPECELPDFVHIFPNPTTQNFSIQFNNPTSSSSTAVLSSVLGQVLAEKNIPAAQTSLDWSFSKNALPSGLYYLKFFDGNQQFLGAKAIVVF